MFLDVFTNQATFPPESSVKGFRLFSAQEELMPVKLWWPWHG